MSLVEDTPIDHLVKTTCFGWIPYSQVTNIESSQIDDVHYAIRKDKITLVLLESYRKDASHLDDIPNGLVITTNI